MIDWDLTSKLVTSTAASLVVVQIGVAVYSIYVTNKRDRMKATLDFYEKINQEIKRDKREIKDKYGPKLTKEISHQIHNERIDASKVNKILNSYERLALGANLEIYDIKVLSKISGKLLIENYERFQEYIEYRRELKNSSTPWIEFENLVLELKRLRGEI